MTAPSPQWLGSQLDGKADFERIPRAVVDIHLVEAAGPALWRKPASERCVLPRARICRPSIALVNAKQLNGKELSYNNILDTDACWTLVREFDEPAVVVLKHQNPCGSATAVDAVTAAYDKAFACDPKSAYGGIIAANVEVTLGVRSSISTPTSSSLRCIIAPELRSPLRLSFCS